MEKYLFSLSFLLSVCLNAQTWCPPGATWTYKFKNQYMMYEDGYHELRFTHTLTVNGIVCKKLESRRYGTWYWQGSMPLQQQGPEIITYENNGVVFYQTGPQRFDTIANFNANIGDSWYVPGWDSICTLPPTKIVVYDTGHVVINGQSLKRLTITTPSAAAQGNAYIIEKIGPLNGFLHGYYFCETDSWNYLGDFRCYKDDNFAVYSKPGFTDCNFVSLNENSLDLERIKIYPNPNKGLFTLHALQPVNVRIFDQLGSLIYEKMVGEPGEHVFSVPEIAKGLYILRASNEFGSANFKFLKE